jgi:hypothetical protein
MGMGDVTNRNDEQKEDTVMKKAFCILGTIIFFLFQSARTQMGADFKQAKKQEEFFLKLRSQDLNERYRALYYFNQLTLEEMGQDVIDEAMRLFQEAIEKKKIFAEFANRPGKIEDKVPKELLYINSEEFGQYYSLLGRIVGKSKDVKYLPLLLRFYFNADVISNYGDIAVNPVINELTTSTNTVHRILAIVTLRRMLEGKKEGYVARGETREKIKKELIDIALAEKDYDVRVSAVFALTKAGDEDLIPALEKIALSDPFHFEEGSRVATDRELPPGKKAIRYPIRDLARMELEKLKKATKK